MSRQIFRPGPYKNRIKDFIVSSICTVQHVTTRHPIDYVVLRNRNLKTHHYFSNFPFVCPHNYDTFAGVVIPEINQCCALNESRELKRK